MDHVDQKDLHLVCKSKLGYEIETNMFSLLPVHSISPNYDLDFKLVT